MSFFKNNRQSPKPIKHKQDDQKDQKSEDKGESFYRDLISNRTRMEELFFYPTNDALKFRELDALSINRKVMILFLAGAANTETINKNIIKPLLQSPLHKTGDRSFLKEVIKNILTLSSGQTIATFDKAIHALLNGSTVIFIEGEKEAIAVDTIGFSKRAISQPTSELVIKGPKTAFVESVDVNRSLIRRQLKDHRLISEVVSIGKESPQEVTVLYLENIADKELVKNIKERLEQVEKDAVLTLSILEELIEERPYSLFPTCLTTERPDRTASFLLEGHVALLVDNSPDALIAPVTFWSLFHTAEDHFLRWAYGNFARLIRLIAVFLALLMPSIYLSVTTFHPELIPTDLLLAIAGTRERVPFPAFWEVLLMSLTFEILREAGIRVPTPLGPTIGIVGALILGQAAVQANLVSPMLVVVIAITGLSTFSIPDIGLSTMVRMLSLIFVIAAHFLGFIGIAIGMAILLSYGVSIRSFGVPFFSPLAPHWPSSRDKFFRTIIGKEWLRPLSMSPRKTKRIEDEKRNQS